MNNLDELIKKIHDECIERIVKAFELPKNTVEAYVIGYGPSFLENPKECAIKNNVAELYWELNYQIAQKYRNAK